MRQLGWRTKSKRVQNATDSSWKRRTDSIWKRRTDETDRHQLEETDRQETDRQQLEETTAHTDCDPSDISKSRDEDPKQPHLNSFQELPRGIEDADNCDYRQRKWIIDKVANVLLWLGLLGHIYIYIYI